MTVYQVELWAEGRLLGTSHHPTLDAATGFARWARQSDGVHALVIYHRTETETSPTVRGDRKEENP